MIHTDITDKISRILELANSAYQCAGHTRVIRGDGGSWVTDIEAIRKISDELIQSQEKQNA